MPGASEQTSQIKVLNVNWAAGADGEDGRFDVMIVTADGEKHTFAPSPASLTALLALARTDVILLWDPADAGGHPDRRQHRRNLGSPRQDGLTRVRDHHAQQLKRG